MNEKIKADLKQLEIRSLIKSLSYETLEMVFVESKRELDVRFRKAKHASGVIKVEDARLFEDGHY